MKANQVVTPVLPGTLVRYFPERDTENWVVSGWTWLARPIPFADPQVFEVKSYVLDKRGGHVTFERTTGTFDLYGGGRIEDIKFPYPHPMFEVLSEAEAAENRLADQVVEIARHIGSDPKLFDRFMDWLRNWQASRLSRA